MLVLRWEKLVRLRWKGLGLVGPEEGKGRREGAEG